MEKFMVVGNFACQSYIEDDLYSSQWTLGIFDTVEECFKVAKADLKQVARDHYECFLDTDEYESSAEFELAIENNVSGYIEGYTCTSLDSASYEISKYGHSEILSNDVAVDEQRQITKYTVYKLDLSVHVKQEDLLCKLNTIFISVKIIN